MYVVSGSLTSMQAISDQERPTEAVPEISLLAISVSNLAPQHVIQLELPLPPPDPRRPGSATGAARWALDRMRADLGDLPVVLVGHSMGGRTAISVADDPRVVGVVGLAPWIAEDTPTAPLTGKHLVAAHGRADRITSFGATRAFTERAARVAASARFLDMGPLGHYLLRGHQRWRRIAADESLGMLAADAG